MLNEVCAFLQLAGAKHAPLQRFTDEDGCYGRYITLRDPPGVYFMLGTDNADNRSKLDDAVQVIFHEVSPIVEPFADAIGYRAGAIERLIVVWTAGDPWRYVAPIYSVMLTPGDRISRRMQLPDVGYWPPGRKYGKGWISNGSHFVEVKA